MASQKMKDLFGMLAGAKAFHNKNSLQSKMDALVANRPEYQVADEYAENQAIAKNATMGRDQAIQQQEQNINQSAADSVGQAQEVSSSTGSILSTLAAINNNKNDALQQLGVQEGQVARQNRRDLMGANEAMAEEQDKAWNYNVNDPYQTQVAQIRDKQKFRRELPWKILDTVGSVATGRFLGGKDSGTTA